MDLRDELVIPVGTYMRPPGAMRNSAIGVGDPTKIAESFGRSYKPVMPLYLVGPDNRTIILVAGMGQAEAAELEDLALAALDREKASNWEASREARGFPQQANLVNNLRNLGDDAKQQLKRNSRTLGRGHSPHQWSGFDDS